MTLNPYTEIRRVTLIHDGLPVHLILQTRHCVPPVNFFCLSWRTHLPTGSRNRRFYYDRKHRTGIWRIPVSIAICLLNQANAEGMLDEEYDDPQGRHGGSNNTIIDSRDLGRQDREQEFYSIVDANRDPDWGADPVFVIIEVPDKTWRKIMLVDTNRKVCTFRSTTVDDSYRPRADDGMASPWMLDNAMQDASCAMMREFRHVLLSL